jgi:hypothetical protein
MGLLVLPAAGCGSTGVTGDDGTSPADGRDGRVDDDSLEAFCEGSGPVVEVGEGDERHTECTGSIAETTFVSALCTCHDVTVAGYLKTRACDSDDASCAGATDDGGGAVGINNRYLISAGYSDVGGSFAITGPDPTLFFGYLRARGDFRLAGNGNVPGYTTVARNAWFGGNFTGVGPVSIDGDMHKQGNVVGLPLTVDGETFTETVTLDPTCPCADDEILEVGPLVDFARDHNDNATVGLTPTLLKNVIGDVEVTLECGRFYVEEVSGLGNIVVNVTGRVALFVEGNIAAAGNLEFNLTPEGEIDIFVKGDLLLIGNASFGTKDRPAGTRIYVGGIQDITLVGAGGFVGNVYAPRCLVTAVGYAEVWGSVFARDFVSPGYANFVYDLAIQHAGDDCPEPLPPGIDCSRCRGCTGGTACVDGVCTDCRTDEDCCGQEVCTYGRCATLII